MALLLDLLRTHLASWLMLLLLGNNAKFRCSKAGLRIGVYGGLGNDWRSSAKM
jgi:hypothetical protein